MNLDMTVASAQLFMEREKALQSAICKYHRALIQTVYSISTVEAHHDSYTAKHQRSVGVLSFSIGRELGLDQDRLEGLYLGALLHDIGKVALPAKILMKPDRLTREEYALVKTHVQTGCEILADIAFPWPIQTIVAQHHERLDGSGYPHGLTADAICLEARIVAVADVFDAMCERRPYRETSGTSVAFAELDRSAGKTLDHEAVRALKAITAAADKDGVDLMSRLHTDLLATDFAAGYGSRPDGAEETFGGADFADHARRTQGRQA